jgi:hypothetical protein
MSNDQQSKQLEEISQSSLLLEFFQQNPNRDIPHPEIVDWAIAEYLNRTGKIFRDPDRGIRKLHQDGYLVKVSTGVYRYDPELVKKRDLEDFSEAMKQAIFKRDDYKCVVCGKGKKDGMVLHADHIKPKDLGGRAVLESGQTLCGPHNFLKKNFNQTEIGKKLFIRLYELAKTEKDQDLMKFASEVLEVFEKNKKDDHIKWTR